MSLTSIIFGEILISLVYVFGRWMAVLGFMVLVRVLKGLLSTKTNLSIKETKIISYFLGAIFAAAIGYHIYISADNSGKPGFFWGFDSKAAFGLALLGGFISWVLIMLPTVLSFAIERIRMNRELIR